MSNQLVSLKTRVLSHLRRLRKDDNGAAAVAMAVMSPVLIGGLGIGAETGYWYFTQRKLQHAADVAVHAAAVRKRVGDDRMGQMTAAVGTASGSGFVPYMDYSTPNPTIANLIVNDPPASGSFAGRAEAIEVTLFETKPRLLSSIFSKEPVRIGARAVAKVTGGSPACVLALSETKSKAVEVSGSSYATLNGCSVAANSVQPDAYYMPNSKAHLSADCVSTVGGASIKDPDPNLLTLNPEICTSVQENAPKTLDPYAEVPEPPANIPCEPNNALPPVVTPRYNIEGIGEVSRFCGSVFPSAKVTEFKPGLYIFDNSPTEKGGITFNGGNKEKLIGTGVTFFFANYTTANLLGTPTVNLSAPATGPYAGLLFFGARCNPTFNEISCEEQFTVSGDIDSTFQCAVYLPGSSISFTGSSTASSSCLQIIADKVTFTGNSTITMGSSCGTAGTKSILIGQVVKVVE